MVNLIPIELQEVKGQVLKHTEESDQDERMTKAAVEALAHHDEINQDRLEEKKASIFSRIWSWIKGGVSGFINGICNIFKAIFGSKPKEERRKPIVPGQINLDLPDVQQQDGIDTSLKSSSELEKRVRKYDSDTIKRFIDDVEMRTFGLKGEIEEMCFDKPSCLHSLKGLRFEVMESLEMLREILQHDKVILEKQVTVSLRKYLNLYEYISEQIKKKISENKSSLTDVFINIQKKINTHPLINLEDLEVSDLENYLAYYCCIQAYQKELEIDDSLLNEIDIEEVKILVEEKKRRAFQELKPKNENDEDDVVIDLKEKKIEQEYPVKGIANIGNSCYINSANQCLFHSNAFEKIMQQKLEKRMVGKQDKFVLESDDEFKERENIVEAHKAVLEKYKTADTVGLRGAMLHLRNLIFKSSVGKDCGLNDGQSDQYDTEKYIRAILYAYGYHFGLQEIRKSGHEKLKGGYESPSPVNPLELLAAPMIPGVTNIQGLIQDIFEEKEQEDQDGPFQMNTAEHGMLTNPKWNEKLNITTDPSLIPVQLKRYAFDGDPDKIITPIDLGDGTVDFRLAFNSDKPKIYKIRGFCIHSGGFSGPGHYISYMKSGDQWFYTSDSTVYPIDNEETALLKGQDAYVLFYERV